MMRSLTCLLIFVFLLDVLASVGHATQGSDPALAPPSHPGGKTNAAATLRDSANDVTPLPKMATETAATETAPNDLDEAAWRQSDTADSVAQNAPSEAAAHTELESAPLRQFDQRALNQVWMISSRRLGSVHCPTPSLHFQQRLDGEHWRTETSATFFASDPSTPPRRTVIFVHGNRKTKKEALREGMQTYNQAFLEWDDAPPVRFIIWTWPSDKVFGQIRDVRKKAKLADQHAFHLARVLAQLPDANVAIIGFSFGGRLSLGAMHLLGGGCIEGCRLRKGNQPPTTVDLSMVVPAIRHDCFVTTRAKALQHTNRLFLMHNTQDQYLRFYRYFRLDNFEQALGFTGIDGIYCSDRDRIEIQQYDAAQWVGRDHDYLEYLVDKRIDERIRKNLF